MKGLELPINVLIIIAIAVIVLLAVIVLFYSGYGSTQGTFTVESAKTDLCYMLAQRYKCNEKSYNIYDTNLKYDVNGDGNQNGATDPSTFWSSPPSPACGTGAASHDNLASLCYCHYFLKNEADCAKICGC